MMYQNLVTPKHPVGAVLCNFVPRVRFVSASAADGESRVAARVIPDRSIDEAYVPIK